MLQMAFLKVRTVVASLMMSAAVAFHFSAQAEDLAAPAGDVMLTVSGDIEMTNIGAIAAFDQEMLAALPNLTISTTTIWTEGINEYTGVALKDFLAFLGVEDGTLRATAINDYAIEFPVADGLEDGPLLAYLRNGETMSVRDKGPVWLIFPFDDEPKFQNEEYYSRSIWQLDRIEIVE